MEQYSNLNVHGKITQKAAQGTGTDDVVKYSTFNPIVVSSATPYVSGTTYYKGSLVLTNNGLVYLCKVDSPSSNDDFAITGKVYTADGTTVVLDGTQFKQKSDVVTAGTGITIGTTVVGSATEVPKVKVDTYGRVISIDKVTIYPPTTAGTNGQLWKSDGSGAGVWVNQSTIAAGSATNDVDGNAIKTTYAKATNVYTKTETDTKLGDGSVTKVGTATKGGTLKIMYLNAGTPTDGTQLYNNKVTIDGTTSTIVTTGTGPLNLASKTYVDGLIAANDAMVYKGTLGTNGTETNIPSVPYNAGWTYKVITAGTYAGKACEIGDMVICVTDRASGATGSNDDWTVVQNNLEAMKGATSSANGSAGYIGATPPKDGYNTKYWRADGSWQIPPDTKVTAAGNHYTPAADANAALSVDASSTTAATWNSTSLVTGVNIQRDAKGHVTGVTVDSIKMPANPNSDTKVRQTTLNGSDNVNRAMILAYNVNTTTGNTDDIVYRSTKIYANDSTGTITATTFNGNATSATTATTATNATNWTSNPFAATDVTLADM